MEKTIIKKTIIKRFVCSLLTLLLLSGALIGCGKNSEMGEKGVPSAGNNSAEIIENSKETTEKKTLSDFEIVTTSADKVILDCDMGYVNDDAFALMFLLQADKMGYIDLLGVAVSGGNKIGAVAVNLALLQLEAVGRTDVPVYIGRDEPLNGFSPERASASRTAEVYTKWENYVTPDNYHNLGNLYNENWGYSKQEAQGESAADFMVQQVKQYPGEITILCIGPATNVALACQTDETFAQNTAGIIYMGGKLKEDASFNWWYDADAVKVCLESDFPKQIICTSEISGNMQIPSGFITELSDYGDSSAADFFVKRKTIANGNRKLWDVVIPAVLICPELVNVSDVGNVSVSVEEDSYGEMQFVENGTEATIVSEVNGEELYTLMGLLFGEE